MAVFRVIGKVLRGTNARRLLFYLHGPGRANEHIDPHLVAGFADPAELEPEHRPGGSRDLRRLAGLLAQPLAALAAPGYDKPVWHCSLRAAPDDRVLSDQEWAQVAAEVMHRTGLAPAGDERGVRWVAVRHAADHVHIVATLARQDGTRPRIWNDFNRVREACHEAEQRFGLRRTAPAARTAARSATRAETEHAARRGWAEPPRTMLRREVCCAAAAARSQQEFFARLHDAGVLVRQRRSTRSPGEVTGYAVGLRQHITRDGGVIWYGGGKLAPDLTLPKLRTRWERPEAGRDPFTDPGLPDAAVRAVLRETVTAAAGQSRDEEEFFARLRAGGVLVKVRYSQRDPAQVTGYAVTLPGHTAPGGTPRWYGGGRLSASLTLPQLRRHWRDTAAGAPGRSGAFRFTAAERDALYRHAARQAAAAAEHIRGCARTDPASAADAAWAAADTLHVTARELRSPTLRRAADAYDRAARAAHARVPRPTPDGGRLRRAARLVALAGSPAGDGGSMAAITLVASLVTLAAAVTGLRQAQQHAAQAAAARAAADQLHSAEVHARSRMSHPGRPRRQRSPDVRTAAQPAGPLPAKPAAWQEQDGHDRPRRAAQGHRPAPGRRSGPAR